MGIYTNTNSAFPSQVVSDAEKASWEYGTQVAQAIEYEWFDQGRTGGNRYLTNWNNFHTIVSAYMIGSAVDDILLMVLTKKLLSM